MAPRVRRKREIKTLFVMYLDRQSSARVGRGGSHRSGSQPKIDSSTGLKQCLNDLRRRRDVRVKLPLACVRSSHDCHTGHPPPAQAPPLRKVPLEGQEWGKMVGPAKNMAVPSVNDSTMPRLVAYRLEHSAPTPTEVRTTPPIYCSAPEIPPTSSKTD